MTDLLEVSGLSVSFATPRGTVPVLDDVSLSVREGEVVGLVGESGSGKSVTALSILGLLGEQGRVDAGQIRLDGRDLLPLPEREWLRVRGRQVAMIFQEPMTSLNPLLPVGFQVAEVLEEHLGLGRPAARARAVELFRRRRHPGSRAARARLPAPALGRHAPARHDRDGDGLPPAPPGGRRAHDRARRDDPGADPRAPARPRARGGHRGAPDQPRPRGGGDDGRAGSS